MSDLHDNGQVPEELSCPICLFVPEGKVLQCKEGHTVCEPCYKKLLAAAKPCPQCATPYGPEAIRNLALESLIDKLKFNCEFKSSGCDAVLDRHGRQSHRCVNLCVLTGNPHCFFRMSGMSMKETIGHLKDSHKAEVADSESNSMFCKINNVARGPEDIFYPPIIIIVQNMACVVLIYRFYTANHGMVSLFPVFVPDLDIKGAPEVASDYEVEFALTEEMAENTDSEESKKETLMKWRIPPIDFRKASRFLPDFSPVRIPMPMFPNRRSPQGEESQVKFSLRITVSLEYDRCRSSFQKRRNVILCPKE